jgi:23S rRNA-/tRNA-specific pseudouridylate synthase
VHSPHILHVAPEWFVLAKPAGWHTVAGASGDGEVVETWLRDTMPGQRELPEAGLVHRLDRDTSGCLLVAATAASYDRLRDRFRSGTGVRKHYVALAAPGLRAEGQVTYFFTSRHKGSKKVTVREAGDAAHAGRTLWRVRQRGDGGDLVELELVGPGRRHQLRATCAALGHPLVGDVLYGGAAAPGVRLHAHRLAIDGVTVESPLPAWATAR